MIKRRTSGSFDDKLEDIERSFNKWRAIDGQASAFAKFDQLANRSTWRSLEDQIARSVGHLSKIHELAASMSASSIVANQISKRSALDNISTFDALDSAWRRLRNQYAHESFPFEADPVHSALAAYHKINSSAPDAVARKALDEQLSPAQSALDKLEKGDVGLLALASPPDGNAVDAEEIADGAHDESGHVALSSAPDSLPVLSEEVTPPRRLEQIFWLLLPASEREIVLGDAEEAYRQTLAKFGKRYAEIDYAKELMCAVLIRVSNFVAKIIKSVCA